MPELADVKCLLVSLGYSSTGKFKTKGYSMSKKSKIELLGKSAIVLALAFAPSVSNAADINVNGPADTTTQQVAANPGDILKINSGGNLVVGAGAAFDAVANTEVGVVVNSGAANKGIIATDGASPALDFTDPASTIDSIAVTTGIITSNSTGSTININGAVDSYSIGLAAGTSITNTGTGGEVIAIFGSNGNQTATINNSGAITGTNDAGTMAIRINDANGGSGLILGNTSTGSISAGTAGTAISVETGGAGANTLALTNAGTIAGTIVAGVGANDTATITSTGGTIGGGANAITATAGNTDVALTNTAVTGAVNIGSNTGSTLALNTGSSIVGAVTTGDAAQTVTFNGGSVTGDIGGAGAIAVTANTIMGGNFNNTGAVAISAGTLTFGNTARTVNGALTLTGTGGVNFGTAAHTGSADILSTAGATNTISTSIGSSNSIGHLTSNAAHNIAAGTGLNISVGTNVHVDNGTNFTVIDSGSASTYGAMTITDNSALLSFTQVGDANDLIIQAARAAMSTVTTAENSSVGAVLDAIGTANTDTGNMTLLLSAIDNASSAQEVNNLLSAASPQADNSLSQSVLSATGQSFNVTEARLGQARSGSGAGASSGNPNGDNAVWIEGLGATVNQGTRKGVLGYDADTYGVAIGADKKVGTNFRVGVSASYANSQIDSKSISRETEVDTYQANLYAGYERGNYFANGMLGFAWNEYDTTRVIPGVAVADGSTDGQTYLARLGGGYDHKVRDSKLTITPNASLTYAHNIVDSYTETGAGVLNLNVDTDNIDMLQGKLGVDFGYEYKTPNTSIRPEIRLGVLHDIIGDEQATTSSFTGVGTSFSTNGADVAKTSFVAGAGVDLVRNNGLTLSADYDYETKDAYDAHSGMIRARYAF